MVRQLNSDVILKFPTLLAGRDKRKLGIADIKASTYRNVGDNGKRFPEVEIAERGDGIENMGD